MLEYYPEIKWVHVAAVYTSGGLFLLRGFALQMGAGWPMVAPLRYLSYSIDIVLLTAAFMLFTILPGAVFANGWLYTKLALLIVYIVLGSLALKRGSTRGRRTVFYMTALVVYAYMIGVARTHHPLGFLAGLLS